VKQAADNNYGGQWHHDKRPQLLQQLHGGAKNKYHNSKRHQNFTAAHLKCPGCLVITLSQFYLWVSSWKNIEHQSAFGEVTWANIMAPCLTHGGRNFWATLYDNNESWW